jgi:ABC-2 type transport system permease protein
MGGAIKSEIRKIFTTRLWWGLGIGMFVMSALISLGFGALVGVQPEGGGGDGQALSASSPGAAQFVYSAGFIVASIAALFPLSLGVLLITQEFRHKTFTATVLATPVRWKVLVSKIVAIVAVSAVYAVIYDIAAVLGGASILSIKGHPTFLGDGDVQKTLLVMLLAFVVWALLGFGFGMLVRNQIAAVLIAVGVAFLLQLVLNIVFGILGWETASKFVPGNLTTGMLVTSDPSGGAGGPSPYFSWWVCALILTGYAAVLSVAGSVLTARRDIT